MESIEEVKEHCKFVAEGIAKAVDDGEDLGSKFEGSQQIRFLIEKDTDGRPKVVGGWIEADDSGIEVSERGVFKLYGDEYVGTPFDAETAAAMRDFFDTLYWC